MRVEAEDKKEQDKKMKEISLQGLKNSSKQHFPRKNINKTLFCRHARGHQGEGRPAGKRQRRRKREDPPYELGIRETH